jgi:hypothetical protein
MPSGAAPRGRSLCGGVRHRGSGAVSRQCVRADTTTRHAPPSLPPWPERVARHDRRRRAHLVVGVLASVSTVLLAIVWPVGPVA